MKKYLYISLVIITIISLSVIYKLHIIHRKKINHFNFPTTLYVDNYTQYPQVDTLAMIILNKIYLYDTIHLNILNMLINTSEEEQLINNLNKQQYKFHYHEIYLNKNLRYICMKKKLIHELIILNQIELYNLINIKNDKSKVIYNNDTIIFSKVPYNKRSYEKDAFNSEKYIQNKLDTILYSK